MFAPVLLLLLFFPIGMGPRGMGKILRDYEGNVVLSEFYGAPQAGKHEYTSNFFQNEGCLL